MVDLPSHAEVVIIGGGVVGCSVLYHLALKGCSDVVLLERNELTSGSTWHSAGNCPNYSGSWNIMKLQHYSTQLYARLGNDVDYPINYHVTGSIRLAHTAARMDEYRHITSMARHQGIDFEMLSSNEMRSRYPFLEVHDLQGGLWDPGDGDIDPAQLTQAFAKGARDLGAKIFRFCPVTAIGQTASGEWSVESALGTIGAEKVVNAAGYRAREIGAMVGRDVPAVSMQHQYLVTEPISDLANAEKILPLLRDPDDSYYLRQEGDGLLLGPYEWQATPQWLDGLPEDFSFQLNPDDLDRLELNIERACARVPILGSVGVQKVINGPIPYTPDGNPLIGPAPGLRNFYEACVFSFGITQAGGAGKALAEWVVDGETEWDMWASDPRRYTDFATQSYTEAKAVELYQREYATGFPYEERPAGRPSKLSPLYDRLKAKGAVFGARGGWERACWFRRPGDGDEQTLSFRRENWSWFDAVAEECRTVAEGVAVLDLPGFARFEVSGPNIAEWLEGFIAGRVPRPGRVSLAYVCTQAGGVLSEMTITRLAEDRAWLITAAAGEWHDIDLLQSHLPADGSIRLENLTQQYGTLIVVGPKSRDVLSRITDADLSNQAFPWLTVRDIAIAATAVKALRVNYVGELGWELHVPVDAMGAVYDTLMSAGEAFAIGDFGLYAMESLRIEKGYRAWKMDLEIGYSPLKSSLDRFVKLDKPDFPGRAALLKEKQDGPAERFVPLIVDDGGADAPFCATVFHGDERVGLVTSAAYGHRLGQAIALAYVRSDLASEGQTLEIEILGERRGAVVGREPLYDPNNERLRA